MEAGTGRSPAGDPEGTGRKPRLLPGLPPGLLLWLTVLVLWLTWAPFRPSAALSAPVLSLPGDPVELVLNLLLTAPLGMVIGAAGRRGEGGRDRRAGAAVRRALLVALAVSLVAESGQLFLEGRSPSPYDVILNCAGGGAGAVVGWWAAGSRAAGATAGGASPLPALLTASHLYLAALVYALAFSAHLGPAHRLADWRAEFPVAAGQEPRGERAFEGTVDSARICGGPSGAELCLGPGAGEDRRERLVQLVAEGQRVRLEAVVLSRADDQEGPARLLTFSDGILHRNATLALEGRALVLRLRTPLAGPNGSTVEFRLPDAVPPGTPVRVEGRYEAGRVTLLARGPGERMERSFPYPLLSWTALFAWRVRGFSTPQVAAALVLGFLVLFLPPGLAAGLLWGSGRVAPWVAVVGGTGGSAALALLLALQLGLSLPAAWMAGAALAAAAGIPLGRLDRRRSAG